MKRNVKGMIEQTNGLIESRLDISLGEVEAIREIGKNHIGMCILNAFVFGYAVAMKSEQNRKKKEKTA